MNKLESWALFVRTGDPYAYLQYCAVQEKEEPRPAASERQRAGHARG